MQLGEYEKVIEQLKKAMQLDRTIAEGWFLWVEALARLQRFDEAFEKYLEGKSHGKK